MLIRLKWMRNRTLQITKKGDSEETITKGTLGPGTTPASSAHSRFQERFSGGVKSTRCPRGKSCERIVANNLDDQFKTIASSSIHENAPRKKEHSGMSGKTEGNASPHLYPWNFLDARNWCEVRYSPHCSI